MESIGGFFGLEQGLQNNELHDGALRLNSGRNCLRYLLEAGHIGKIYIPYYTCSTVLEPVKSLHIKFSYYKIDENFMPIGNFSLKRDEFLLYINYLGINGAKAQMLAKQYKNIIIDNSQAFFDRHIKGAHTFYSPRKFFGVPDGAYLYTKYNLNRELGQDKSSGRFAHLLKRIEEGPEAAYKFFAENEKKFSGMPLLNMSEITKKLLNSIDYERISRTRAKNFLYLHKFLSKLNGLNIEINKINAPLAYPFLVKKDGLRPYLTENKIYTPVYWKEVLEITNKNSIEARFARYMIPLPIDQRYGIKHMKFVIKKIKEYLK